MCFIVMSMARMDGHSELAGAVGIGHGRYGTSLVGHELTGREL